MKALLLILLATSALAADLEPNTALTFDFPNTLAGMVSGTTKVARLGAVKRQSTTVKRTVASLISESALQGCLLGYWCCPPPVGTTSEEALDEADGGNSEHYIDK